MSRSFAWTLLCGSLLVFVGSAPATRNMEDMTNHFVERAMEDLAAGPLASKYAEGSTVPWATLFSGSEAIRLWLDALVSVGPCSRKLLWTYAS